MTSVAFAKFTFFEAATQHGYVVALMSPRMPKSTSRCQIVIDHERGRVFQLFKASDPSKPVFEYIIPDRTTRESQMMWKAKVKQELDKAWAEYEKSRKAAFGVVTAEPLPSEPSPDTASSTDAPPVSATSSSESKVEATESTDSAPSPQTEPPSKPKSGSSSASKRRSAKKA